MRITIESIKHPFWAMELGEVYAVLDTREAGLHEDEVAARRAFFGPNTIPKERGFTHVRIVIRQITSPLIAVLIVAGLVTLFFGEWVETAVIFGAVIANTILGFLQESKAERALALLKTYIRANARVRRAGQERVIDAQDLVPGDVIRITQGDRIPADARIVFQNNFEVDESVLTGESLPVEKVNAVLPGATALAERRSMVFGGALAVQGFADAAVTSTGIHTEFGRIAGLLAERERVRTPLQRAIARFTLTVGLVLVGLIGLLFVLGVYFGYGVLEMFLIAVAVAVSAVPESLPVAVTVVLAVGVQRLAARRGVVRQLLAAETLGSTSIILTDKTGTLTQAKMELASVLPYQEKDVRGEERLLREAVASTDVVIENPTAPPVEWRMFGKPLEMALVRDAAMRGVSAPSWLGEIEVLDRLPFSSDRKFAVTGWRSDSRYYVTIMGAPETIFAFTDLEEGASAALKSEVEQLAFSGERVLAVVTKEVPGHEKIHRDGHFRHFHLAGLIGFRDPLRPHAGSAIRRMAEAGVKTIMVTGDHRGTAEAVARALGMVDGKGAVLTGDDLNYLQREEWLARSGEVSIYARVTPEQKVKIVELYQEKGEVVAVTGDGVNDAPALEAADIGVAVGSGTDVTKGAADLVILDNNFETIAAAVEEGRKILDNIRKVIVYLLSSAFDELLLIGGALAVGIALPLSALQILFVNFFSDSFPAVALAFEKGIDGLGSRPRKLHHNLLDREMQFLILVIGFATSAFLFALYYFMLKAGIDAGLVRTFIFASFGTYSLLLAFSVRSLEKSIVTYNPFSNLYLVGGVAIGFILTGLVIFVPFFQQIFGTVALPLPWVGGVLAVGLFNILAVEFGKWLFRRRNDTRVT